MNKTFESTRIVRHGHTDPAGFAFYPRYYEMVAEVIEDFFRDVLGRPFGEMHLEKRVGVPTVHIETDFHAPSYCDYVLTFALAIAKIGRASATFIVRATCDGEKRLTSRHTIANVRLDAMKSIPFDDDLRSGLSEFLISEDGDA
jgi:4-hydroxybenzoyl-CoA thioesterase